MKYLIFFGVALCLITCLGAPSKSQNKRNRAPTSPSGSWQVVQVLNTTLPKNSTFKVNISDTNINFQYCNHHSYNYTHSKKTIQIGDGTSTEMYCPVIAPPENEVVGALANSTTFIRTNNRMQFMNNGQVTWVLNKLY